MKKLSLFLSAALFCSSAFSQIDLKKGLILHLPFNGNTLDASPNANHATNFGAKLTTDQWGNANSAYSFNGKSSYMQILNNVTLQPDSQLTICARVKPNGFYNGPCYGNFIVQKGANDWCAGCYGLRYNYYIPDCSTYDTIHQNYLGVFNDQYPVHSTVRNAPYVVKELWDCVIYTYNGVEAKMYVNGILRFQFPTSARIGKNNADVFLGYNNNPSYPYWLSGTIDEVRIYNRGLNIAEIDSICSNVNPQQQGSSIRQTAVIENLHLGNNPVGDELLLNLTAKQMGGDLTIVDMTGKTVLKMSALQTNKITLEGIASGMYIVNYLLDNSYLRAKMVKK